MPHLKRIAIISPEYVTFTNWGGVARFHDELATLLAQAGHEVHVITYGDNKAPFRAVKREGVTVHYLTFKSRYKWLNFLYYHFPFGWIRALCGRYLPLTWFSFEWNWFALAVFRKLQAMRSFDLIHTPTHFEPAWLIHRCYPSIPLIVHLHGPQRLFTPFEVASRDVQLKAWLEDRYMKAAAVVVPVSKEIEAYATERLPVARIRRIGNFFDTTCYRNTETVDRNTFVYLGRLDYRKGVDVLLRAFAEYGAQHPRAQLFLIGNQEMGMRTPYGLVTMREWWSSQDMSSVAKRIYFVPRIDDRNALVEVLVRLKGIAVLPSRFEPYSYAMLELMALGYVVVASKRGGGQEVINHGKDGLLVEPTVAGVLEALETIAGLSQKELTMLGKKAAEKVEKLAAPKRALADYTDLYEALE